MMSAAIVSMNMPTNRRSRLISRITRNLLSVMDRTALTIICGMRSAESIDPKTLAKPTSARMPADETALSMTIFGTLAIGSSR